MLPQKTIYRFHVQNLRLLDTALVQIKRTTHEAISGSNPPLLESFTRLFALTLGAWAETRLQKVLLEQNGFSDNQRALVNAENKQFDKWKRTVELAVRHHYNIPTGPLNQLTFSHSIYSKFNSIKTILENDLRPVIEIRNKLAHGQWIYPFTDTLELNVAQKTAIENENILSLQFKHRMIGHLCQAIHDLVVSRPTFERDFDINFRKFMGTKQNLENRSYEKYCEQLKERRLRGKQTKVANFKQIT